VVDMAKKKKNMYTILIESPVTHAEFQIKKAGKFMDRATAQETLTAVLPKYPKKMYKTKIKKISFIDKILNR
jgi:hypothetical protein